MNRYMAARVQVQINQVQIKISRLKFSDADQSSYAKQRKGETMNESVQRKSHLSQTRQITSARQIQKLAKDENSVFLAVVISTNEAPHKRGKKGNKRSPDHVARFAAHGLTEGQKRLMNRKTG